MSSRIPDRHKPKRQQVRIGAPDRALTANAGLAAVTELCDRLGVIEALDAAVGRSSGGIAATGPGSC